LRRVSQTYPTSYETSTRLTNVTSHPALPSLAASLSEMEQVDNSERINLLIRILYGTESNKMFVAYVRLII